MNKPLSQRKIIIRGNQFERQLGPIAKKKKGYFGWQYSDGDIDDEHITYEFCFDYLSSNAFARLVAFFHKNAIYKPQLSGGLHYESDSNYQICIRLTVPLADF